MLAAGRPVAASAAWISFALSGLRGRADLRANVMTVMLAPTLGLGTMPPQAKNFLSLDRTTRR
jgi:hypothetical protein